MSTYERFEGLPVWQQVAHLQNSDIAGPRHLNDNVRQRLDSSRRTQALQQHIQRILPPDHLLRSNSTVP